MRTSFQRSLLGMALALPLLSTSALADEDSQRGMTLGIDAGQAEARDICNNVADCSSDDTAVRGSIGYQFNRMFALEIGYSSFGTVFEASDNNFSASQDANAWTASAIGTIPIGERFGIYGRIGAARFDNETTGTVQGVPVSDDNETKPYGGLGLKFGLTDNFALRAEYQRYADLANIGGSKDDVDAWSGGAVFTF